MSKVLTDWRGNTYTVGSTVCYATTEGRSPVMKEGVVVSITMKESFHYNYKQGTNVKLKVTTQHPVVGIRRLDHHSRWSDKPWDGKQRVSFPTVANIIAVPERYDG